MRYESRIVAIALAALLPIAVVAMLLAFRGDYSIKFLCTLALLIVVAILVVTFVLREQLTYPLRTLSNLLTALREEDYSLRARSPRGDDALGEVLLEVNSLAATLTARKFEAIEATALLQTVLGEIDAAIFAFDSDARLRLVNRAGEQLLGKQSSQLLGRSAAELALATLLETDRSRIAEGPIVAALVGGTARWDVRRSTFREQGRPHRLLVLSNISRALREEEAEAWRRIVRVLGHELNNSLAPIKSIADSVGAIVERDPLADDWRDDVIRGMQIIGARSDALARFTKAYAQLARLPEPRRQPIDLVATLRRTAALETRLPVIVETETPPIVANADEDQLEQLLINIIRNAADASLETGGRVTAHIRVARSAAEIRVEDDGHGLSGSANLFVPFFTTKPNGTGIGLVLSRQIAENHGGTLTLENRDDAPGCVATLRLPLTF